MENWNLLKTILPFYNFLVKKSYYNNKLLQAYSRFLDIFIPILCNKDQICDPQHVSTRDVINIYVIIIKFSTAKD